ncbi:MAG: DUF2188 domain-containing protein [Fibrobacterales bacterium]
MAKNQNIHVVPHPEGWASKGAGNSRASAVCGTQAEAINYAKEHAKAEVLIHGRNGQIRERNSYGNDPYPPKG